MIPAIFAAICVLILLACIIGLIIERVRDWRLDRDIEIARREYEKLSQKELK